MKHAGEAALDELEPVLGALRKLPRLKEKKRGTLCWGEGVSALSRGPGGAVCGPEDIA